MPSHKQKIPKMLTLVALLLLTAIAMLAIKKCSHPSDRKALFAEAGALPPKSGDDTLDIAIEISPLSYSLSGDSAHGLDYDILTSMAAKNGLALKFHAFAPLDWAISGLEKGNFDILVSSLQSTSSLKERLPVTTSVYIDRQVLVQRKDTPHFISSPEQLGGDTVWIAKGSPAAQRIRNLSGEIGDSIFISDDEALTSEHLVMLTASGTIPRCVVSQGIAESMAEKDNNLDFSTPVSFNQFQVWAVSPANDRLRQRLDSMIEDFKLTETYKSLLDKYLKY